MVTTFIPLCGQNQVKHELSTWPDFTTQKNWKIICALVVCFLVWVDYETPLQICVYSKLVIDVCKVKYLINSEDPTLANYVHSRVKYPTIFNGLCLY